MMHILRTYPQNGAYPHGISSAVIGEAANEDCDQANPHKFMDGRHGCESGVWGFGFLVSGCGPCGWWVTGFGFRISGGGFRFRASGFGVQVSDFGFRVVGFGLRASGFGLRVSCFVFGVAKFGRVTGGSRRHLLPRLGFRAQLGT